MVLRTEDAQLFRREIELIRFYRDHPVLAAEDLLQVKLAVPQQRVFEDMWFRSFVIYCAGRGCGKSYLDAVFACLWALLWPGQKVGILAPSFRQSKIVFSEVDKIWHRAPLLQEATQTKPIRASDRCYLAFKQAGNSNPSMIEAVPTGDGQKIRGARYYCIIADEFAQIPVDIFNTVIRPMGATVIDPMDNVERLARIDALIRAGRAKREDFEETGGNKIIMSSSAYFQFNHMFETIREYKKLIESGDKKHAYHGVSYRDMPKGFLDEDNIKNARRTMSRIQFRMEYEAIWEADSAGVFKASLIEECSNLENYTVRMTGEPGKQYVLGVDPARASDGFALTLVELGRPNRTVAAWEFYQMVFPKMAKFIMEVCDEFNVVAVHMDAGAGGGGLAMKDLLAEESVYHGQRLLDAGDETTMGLNGRRILHMFKPSPTSNAEAIYATLNLMENKLMAFPRRPQIRTDREEAFEEMFETIETMLRQLLLIEVSQSKSGVAHFDVPTGGGHGTQKKDLYTSFILAAKKAYDIALMANTQSNILEVGLIENLKLPEYPVGDSRLSNSLDVLNAPMNSWAYRKTFRPSK